MMATRDHLETLPGKILSIAVLKKAARSQDFVLSASVLGSDVHHVFKTLCGLRSFTLAELRCRAESSVDTRAYECFLAFSVRPMELSRLVKGQERLMYSRFDDAGTSEVFGTQNVSLVYGILSVPLVLQPGSNDKLAGMLYRLVLSWLSTTRAGIDNEAALGPVTLGGLRPMKRSKIKYNVIPVRSGEIAQGSAMLKSRQLGAALMRPVDVLAKRIQHVVNSFDYIAEKCGFPSAERTLFPVMG